MRTTLKVKIAGINVFVFPEHIVALSATSESTTSVATANGYNAIVNLPIAKLLEVLNVNVIDLTTP